jgi:hypothetical protein
MTVDSTNFTVNFAKSFRYLVYCFADFLEQSKNLCIEHDAGGDEGDSEGKCFFQILEAFDKPDEFLQSSMDMLRVVFDPNPLATLILNSNPFLLVNEFGCELYRFVYCSQVSEANESFSVFWQRKLLNYLPETTSESRVLLYVVASTGKERYTLNLLSEIADVLDVERNSNAVFERLANYPSLKTKQSLLKNQSHIGFFMQEELEQKIRISVWHFDSKNKLN